MKLYYKPGACSLAAHMALHELDLPFTLEAVDTARGTTASSADFRAINPKGYVPVLELEDGEVLTESAAVLQYLADRRPEAGLAPAAGTMARVRLQEHLNYLSSEVHKAFGIFFSGRLLSPDEREAAVARVLARLAPIEALLADGRLHLLGETFTVADAYLFVLASWADHVGISLERLPHLDRFIGRVASRETTRAAMRAEGLAA